MNKLFGTNLVIKSGQTYSYEQMVSLTNDMFEWLSLGHFTDSLGNTYALNLTVENNQLVGLEAEYLHDAQKKSMLELELFNKNNLSDDLDKSEQTEAEFLREILRKVLNLKQSNKPKVSKKTIRKISP